MGCKSDVLKQIAIGRPNANPVSIAQALAMRDNCKFSFIQLISMPIQLHVTMRMGWPISIGRFISSHAIALDQPRHPRHPKYEINRSTPQADSRTALVAFKISFAEVAVSWRWPHQFFVFVTQLNTYAVGSQNQCHREREPICCLNTNRPYPPFGEASAPTSI